MSFDGAPPMESGRLGRAFLGQRQEQILNLWGSCVWSRAFGGNPAPDLSECIEMIPGAPALPQSVQICDSSWELYDGTPGKYRHAGAMRIDQAVQSAFVHVEKRLHAMGHPRLLIELLLWLYPEDGRFSPERRGYDANLPYRGFRPQGLLMPIFGRGSHLGGHADRAIDRFLKAAHLEFGRAI